MRKHSTTAKLYSFWAIFALILTGFAVTPSGESAITSSGVFVTDRGYQDLLTSIYGSASIAHVVVNQSGLDKSDQRDRGPVVTVHSSTAGTTDLTIDTLETGPKTGTFLGSFGFAEATGTVQATSHPFLGKVLGNGKINVTDGADITVTAASVTGQSTFKWYRSFPAAVYVYDGAVDITNVSRALASVNNPLTVRLRDRDLNRDTSTVQSHPDLVRAFSTSDVAGVPVAITENSVSSSGFEGLLTFEATNDATNNRLWVQKGDVVRVVYSDPYDERGLPTRLERPTAGTWTTPVATSGTLVMDRATYFGSTTATPTGEDRATITVLDPDQNTDAQVQSLAGVTVRSVDNAPVNVPMMELGGDSGLFVGTVYFNTAPDGNGVVLQVGSTASGGTRDTITVVYSDAGDQNNQPQAPLTTAGWRKVEDATLTFAEGATLAAGTGPANAVSIEVADADSNANPNGVDTIIVQAKSTSDPMSVDISLVETSQNSAVFSGSLEFATATTAGKLRVADGDLVAVQYNDPRGASGIPTVVRSSGATAFANALSWRGAADAQVFTDAVNYFREGVDTAYSTVANVYVIDSDRDNPFVHDVIGPTDQNRVFAVTVEATPQTIGLTMNEVGVNSGIFHGILRFANANDQSGEKLGVGAAPLVTQREFQIKYLEPLSAGGGPRQTATSSLTFWNKPSTTKGQLEVLHSSGSDNWFERQDVVYPAATGDTTVRVAAYKSSPPGTLTLAADDCSTTVSPAGFPVDGRYEFTITLHIFTGANCPTDANVLGIRDASGTLTLREGPTTLALAAYRDRTAEALAFRDASLTAPMTRVSGLKAPAYLQLTGGLNNDVSTGRDVVVADVFPRSATSLSEHTQIVLLETGADTNTFVGSMQFGAAANDGMQVVKVSTSPFGAALGDMTPGGDIAELIAARGPGGVASAGIEWYPAADGLVMVADNVFGGNGAFQVSITGDDGRTNRVFAEARTGQASLSPFQPYIPGTELVYVERTETRTGFSGTTTTGTPGVDGKGPLQSQGRAGEAIADKDHDGKLTCGDTNAFDVVITASITTTNVLGQTSTANQPLGACTVNSDATFNFATGCPTPCDLKMIYWYRSKSVDPCPGAADDKIFAHRRLTSSVSFCTAPAGGQNIVVDYAFARRNVIVKSPGETKSFALTFDPATGAFAGSVPVFVGTSSTDGKILVSGSSSIVSFGFNDPFQTFDGKGGSDLPTHFRARFTDKKWSASEDAQVDFRSRDFAQSAANPIFGDSVPIRVVDKDADVSPARDAIVVEVQNGNAPSEKENVVLHETGDATGIFIGNAHAACTALGSTSGDVGFGASPCAGGTLVANFFDAHTGAGVGATRSATIGWKPGGLGTIQFFRTKDNTAATLTNMPQGADEGIIVRVTDADANQLTGVRDQIQVRIVSDSSPTGLLVTAQETSLNTGIFETPIVRFEATPTAGSGRLLVRDNTPQNEGPAVRERVWAVYNDGRNANGDPASINSLRSTPNAITSWDRTFDGAVDLESPFYIGLNFPITGTNLTVSKESHGDRARGVVTVADGDKNVHPNVVDTIEAPALTVAFLVNGAEASGSTFNFTRLVETGANTGVFMGLFTFKSTTTGEGEILGPTAAKRLGKVGAGSGTVADLRQVRGVYADAVGASGAASNFGDLAVWHPSGTGVLWFTTGQVFQFGQTATLMLLDANADPQGNNQHSVSVRVVSQENPTGVSVTLTEELDGTDKDTGRYSGTVQVVDAPTTSPGQINVQSVDSLSATYADGNPAANRVATMPVSIGDVTPPTTTLIIDPAQPTGTNGANGVYRVKPKISFTVSEPGTTFLKRTPSGAAESYVAGSLIELADGDHTITYWSVDAGGRKEADKTAAISVDTVAPTATITGLTAVPIADGKVHLTWDNVEGLNDPTKFFAYAIMRGTVIVQNATSNSTDDAPTTVGTFSYKVAVSDKAGNLGPFSSAVSVTTDATKPTLGTPTVSPLGFDVRAKPAGISVSATASDAESGIGSVNAFLFGPSGSIIAQATLTSTGGAYTGSIPTTNVTQPCACKVRVSAKDRAGNERTSDVNMLITGPDTQKPAVNLGLPNSNQVEKGTPITVQVSDNVAIAKISYTVDGASSNVAVTGLPSTFTFTIPTTNLALGAHLVTVTVEDNATTEANVAAPNVEVKTVTVTVVEPTGNQQPTPGLTGFCETEAVPQPDGSIKVTWTPGTGVPSNAKFQVWRASSPFTLVATINDPNQRSFTDTKTEGGKSYIYQVTWFVETAVASLSQVAGFTSEEAITGSGRVTAKDDSGLPGWIWWLVGGLAVAAIIVLVVVALIRRGGRDGRSGKQILVTPTTAPPAAEPTEGAGLEERPAGDVHRLKCPECQHRFEVVGQKPIVTHCPSCGRKGILR